MHFVRKQKLPELWVLDRRELLVEEGEEALHSI
jgi:hypothetical protein